MYRISWKEFNLEILQTYVRRLGKTCHIPKLPTESMLKRHPSTLAFFTREIEQIFTVPRLFNELQNKIHRCRIIEAFLCFLLQLLCRNPDPTGGRILENLEMELRCLLAIVGDVSWTMVDHEAQSMAEFEAVANEVGRLVHYLLFSPHPFNPYVMDDRTADVLNHIHLFKSSLQSSDITSIPLHTTPETSVVNSIPILNSLVDDLLHLLEWEDSGIAEVKDQINLLHKGLQLLQSSMSDMRSPQPSELKLPLMRIGDIASRAESLINAFLVKDAPLWYVIATLTYLNSEIERIGMELQEITQKYKFGGLKVAESFIAQPPLEDERKKGIFVGFEEKETQILDQLVGGGTKSLQVVSILGMAGLGKTTLAKKLFNHPLLNYTFDKLSWSVISQTHGRQSILADILIQINSALHKDKISNMEEESLIEHIYKTLKGRRYLVVMDDIWDANVWNELRRCFPDDSNGSRILLTSRSKNVIPPNSMNHELPLLTDEQCLELLEKKVFGSRTCPPQLQQIGKKIAAKCHGLPLTVVVIAGVLSTVDEEEGAWDGLRGSLASYIDGEEYSVMNVLELSYKNLSDYLKPCFLHFAVYVEDEEISVRELKRFWIAEGFIRRETQKSKESVAEEYLMELIDRNLVMVGKRRSDGRGVKTCVLHDLLRDLCLKKCKEESFLQYLKNDCHNIFGRGHRLRALKDSQILSFCRRVRSIYGGNQFTSIYVGDMISLRVLHFNQTWDAVFFGVEYLANLRYLVIEQVPTFIDMLLNLEYIRLYLRCKGCIPPTIVKMKKLRYFSAWEAEYRCDWSSECESNSLEYISRLVIKVLKDEELLKHSPHLLTLKCSYKPEREAFLDGEYPRFDLSFLTQLGSLSLSYPHNDKFEFGFPPNIRKLSLIGSNMPWEKMLIVGRLENLEVLKLKSYAFLGERWETRDGEFQKLRFLLIDTTDLFEWNVASSEHFPQLQRLILRNCYNLHEIPSEIGESTTLELIEVKGVCKDSMLESAESIKREQWEMGNEELRVLHNVHQRRST